MAVQSLLQDRLVDVLVEAGGLGSDEARLALARSGTMRGVNEWLASTHQATQQALAAPAESQKEVKQRSKRRWSLTKARRAVF